MNIKKNLLKRSFYEQLGIYSIGAFAVSYTIPLVETAQVVINKYIVENNAKIKELVSISKSNNLLVVSLKTVAMPEIPFPTTSDCKLFIIGFVDFNTGNIDLEVKEICFNGSKDNDNFDAEYKLIKAEYERKESQIKKIENERQKAFINVIDAQLEILND